MNEMKSIESKTALTQKFKRKIMSKKMTKYIADINYFDKALIALSATRGGISIISSASLNGVHAGIASASFTLVFYFDNKDDKETVRTNKK